MKKTTATAAVFALSAAMALGALAGCSGTSGSSTSNSNASSSASQSATASSTASNTTSSASTSSTAANLTIDGVDVTKLALEMVGETPNFQLTLSNGTANDVEVDLSKFKVEKADGAEVNFHLTKKTVQANTPYAQHSFAAEANALKVGDKVKVSYDGTALGEYEVGEF